MIIYTRQSMDRTGEELGVTRQREDAEQLAKLRGWTAVRTLTDNDRSAAGRKPREGFEALLQALERGEAQAVIAWDWTRLERNRRDGLRLIETCQKHGVTLAFVRGADIDLSTPAGRLVADVLSGVARHEIDQKSDRQRRAMLQAAQDGRWVSGRKPFGYQPDGVTIVPEEADAVRWGFDSVLSGVPLAEIAREWNARGFSGQSREWKWGSVRHVLANPRYAGLRAHSGEIVGRAVWPAVVSEETWRAAQDIFEKRAAMTTPRGARRLLTAIGRCGGCDATVHAGGAFSTYPMYRCGGYTKSPGGKADPSVRHVHRKALPIEDFVSRVVIERLSQPDAAELLIDRKRPDTGALRAEAVALRERLENLAIDYADGTLTKSQMRTANERLTMKLNVIESQLADAGRVDVLGPLVKADDVAAVWETLGTARQRLVIDTLMIVRLDSPGRGVSVFRPETVRIEWK
ncbi:Site-specific DNA recombinase [Microbispora rosea]|uniref:Site-specific DNA recombinase n=1 Tax=Microbispora rosea TaxID=58117 RepID=A0A1N7AIA5_9ACTN|nr:serine recombinase [Microbispora rosea subsp. rosea]SIR38731.1 Site-specific DNA recombinase [Microbispora rosea]